MNHDTLSKIRSICAHVVGNSGTFVPGLPGITWVMLEEALQEVSVGDAVIQQAIEMKECQESTDFVPGCHVCWNRLTHAIDEFESMFIDEFDEMADEH